MPELTPILTWLDRLVSLDTTSHKTNLPLVEAVRAWLTEHGQGATLVYDGSGHKAALLATLGPKDRPGIVLSGHTDCVPVDGQSWSGNPYRLQRDGDRLIARGACDMKGFLACVLAAVPRMRAAALRRPFHIAFSYDEEVGCKGVVPLIDALRVQVPVSPEGCVVGEPTGMKVVDGHKGKGGWRCTVTGRGGHSALTHVTANAVVAAAEIVAEIGRVQRELAAIGPFFEGFTPAHTTASVGRIEGGGQLNLVPDRCSFEFEFRTIPGEAPSSHLERVRDFADREVLPRLRAVADDAEIRFDEIMAYPGLVPSLPTAFTERCRALTGTERPSRVAYGTEAGHFAARSIACVVCGPGNMADAHRADEHVTLDQLAACGSFIDGLIESACRET